MISFVPWLKKIGLGAVALSLSVISNASAGEAPQKLRVAYAAVTAAFSIPWIAKEAGIFQRHGLDVELVYIAAGSRAVQTLVGGSIDRCGDRRSGRRRRQARGSGYSLRGHSGQSRYRFHGGAAA